MDEACVFENRGGRRGFGVDGKVGQEAAFGLGECAGDKVKGWECDESIAKAA
jgi:hypothetical protein